MFLFLIFSLRSPRPQRFQEKCVKMNFDDPYLSRREGCPSAHIFEIWEREKSPTAPKFVPKGQLKNNFLARISQSSRPLRDGYVDSVAHLFPQINLRASGIPSLSGRFFFPLSFNEGKRGGQGVSLMEIV